MCGSTKNEVAPVDLLEELQSLNLGIRVFMDVPEALNRGDSYCQICFFVPLIRYRALCGATFANEEGQSV